MSDNDLIIIGYENRNVFKDDDPFDSSYTEKMAIIELAEDDMKSNDITDDENVLVYNDDGEVIVKAKKIEEGDVGIAGMPKGPWFSALLSDKTEDFYRHIHARIKKTGDHITTIESLFG